MARGENPGVLLTIETTLTYDKDVDFGHASAGKDLMLAINGTGADLGKAGLGADDERILGKFVSLDKDAVASYMPSGQPMLLRKTSATIVAGRALLCAGAGKVKSTPDTPTAASAANGRGQVTKIIETGDNGRILALMP